MSKKVKREVEELAAKMGLHGTGGNRQLRAGVYRKYDLPSVFKQKGGKDYGLANS